MANWFGSPKRGEKHLTYRDVRVIRRGLTWTASWHVDDGKLYVSSAHGSRTEPVSPKADHAALVQRATALLEEIVEGRP